ncbi:MAG: succinyldiaminopimelate transaminase [Gammaproteobacteria bacterium]|nr:succinyldiaminopimelate transaminase [Gammaproteobacteria bacterium]
MNPGFAALHRYPFEKLAQLLADVSAPAGGILDLAIGEPKHPTPAFVHEVMAAALPTTGKYPATRGTAELRGAIADWLSRRYGLAGIDPDTEVLPLTGTREGLFSIAQCIIDRSRADAAVLMPNPGYQIYEGAALLAGAEPVYLDCEPDTGYLPALGQVEEAQWRRCQLLYLCNPGNPSGAVMPMSMLTRAVELAQAFDFIVVADECYAELYGDEAQPPAGILAAAEAAGVPAFSRCLAMHSLSKRSNAPGLRSGFVAGDANVMAQFLRYRTYHGCAMPLYTQQASIAAWCDEAHVVENRARYREKFAATVAILAPALHCATPPAGFYLWLNIGGDDQAFARRLYGEHGVRVLPGSLLAREHAGTNPGAGHIRVALVPELSDCVRAAEAIRQTYETAFGH